MAGLDLKAPFQAGQFHENPTPQMTSLAILCSHPAAPAGSEGPDGVDVFPCEDGQAVEQVGQAGPPLGASETQLDKAWRSLS